MISIINKTDCCGCTACVNICPKNCITMAPDEEGFLYPEVNKDLCINCGICEKVCPVKFPPIQEDNKQDLEGFVVRTKNEESLNQATSGGFVNELNSYVISEGGYACGCVFDEDYLTKHYITRKKEELWEFSGSKYVQSELSDSFINIKRLLDDGFKVCFTGTPCQVAGLNNFLRKDYENLITTDLVCRSIPSTLLYKKYLNFQQSKYKSKIKKINFRNKTYGYHSGSLVIEFENGKKYSGSNRVDLYMKTFHANIASRPSCYECKFKTKDRCSDFTAFDCWKPENVVAVPINDDDRGYTNVIAHSDKAKKIINKLQNIKIYKADVNKMFLYTGGMESKSIKLPENRQRFFDGLKKISCENFDKYIKSYISISARDIIFEKLKLVLYKTKLLKLLKKLK